MDRIRNEILNKALEIGFNCQKYYNSEKIIISYPCSITLKNGEFYKNTIIYLIKEPKINHDYVILKIDDIEIIEKSEYSLSHEFRKESLVTPEYRNDFPFFLRTNKNRILAYNAIEPINFTLKKEIKGVDIIEVVDFETARKEGFEFVKNNLGKIALVYCDFDKEIIEKLKTNA